MIRIRLTLALFAILLAACGTDGEPPTDTAAQSPGSDVQVADEKASSEVAVSGAENFEFTKEVRFLCKDDQILLQTFTASPKFELFLPADIGTGEFDLAEYDPNARSAVAGKAVLALQGKAVKGSGSAYGKLYSRNPVGKATITAMPTGPGDVFAATVTASLDSAADQTIEVRADLNIETDGFSMSNCQLL